jgi:phosphoglycolate phosphatase-like HAD superfamily hydrolase
MLMDRRFLIYVLLLLVLVFSAGVGLSYFYFQSNQQANLASIEQENVYIAFLSEVYDKIKDHYWNKITDEQLTNLFVLGAEKLTGASLHLKENSKEELTKALEKLIEGVEESKKKLLAAELAQVVLTNLQPTGRNALYTDRREKELQNMIQNINLDSIFMLFWILMKNPQ